MFEWIADPQIWLSLATLTLLEIVLGIDNIIFLSIVVAKLPKRLQNKARRMGLIAAMFMRLALLASISWIVTLKAPLFSLLDYSVSTRNLILLLGGLFLIGKSSKEICLLMGYGCENPDITRTSTTFFGAIIQIMLLDIVFSLDSVLTAVGLSKHLIIMMTAVIIAVGVMMFAARPIGDFVDRHPSVKMLALAFLILIGFTLILDSVGIEISKGYIYGAIMFSLAVEILNLCRSKRLGLSELFREIELQQVAKQEQSKSE